MHEHALVLLFCSDSQAFYLCRSLLRNPLIYNESYPTPEPAIRGKLAKIKPQPQETRGGKLEFSHMLISSLVGADISLLYDLGKIIQAFGAIVASSMK